MEKEFVSYEQAKELHNLGFRESCFNGWNKDLKISYQAPLKQQVFKFFRDKYDLYSTISDVEIYASTQGGYRWKWIIFKPIVDVCISSDESLLGHLTYEEAENNCIDNLIELAKNKL